MEIECLSSCKNILIKIHAACATVIIAAPLISCRLFLLADGVIKQGYFLAPEQSFGFIGD